MAVTRLDRLAVKRAVDINDVAVAVQPSGVNNLTRLGGDNGIPGNAVYGRADVKARMRAEILIDLVLLAGTGQAIVELRYFPLT